MNLKERLGLLVRQSLTGASTNTSVNCGAAEIHSPLALSEWWVTGGGGILLPSSVPAPPQPLPVGSSAGNRCLGSVKQAAKPGEK